MNYIFIIIIIIIIGFIFYIFNEQKKEHFEFPMFFGRNPDGKFSCCGNMDWYLGEDYRKYCGKTCHKDFVQTELTEGFEVKTEMVEETANIGNSEYDKELKKCQAFNKEWIAAYNPSVCQEEETVIAEANCMCIDKKFRKCRKCYPKIDMSKYTQ